MSLLGQVLCPRERDAIARVSRLGAQLAHSFSRESVVEQILVRHSGRFLLLVGEHLYLSLSLVSLPLISEPRCRAGLTRGLVSRLSGLISRIDLNSRSHVQSWHEDFISRLVDSELVSRSELNSSSHM